MSNELTRAEARQLEQYEATIQAGMSSFMDVGRALYAIREEQLYLGTHDTFEQYCRDRWHFSDRYARQLITSMEAAEDVQTVIVNTGVNKTGTMVPVTERVSREIAKVETETERADLWAKAVETAPRNHEDVPIVTAAHVAKTRKELFPEEPKPVNYPEKVQKILEQLNTAVEAAQVDPAETLWQKVLAYVLQLKQKLEGHSVKPAKFIQPSESEVAAYLKEYCAEKKIRSKVSAEGFVSFYESNGWKVGKNPMKDWRAAVRQWIAREGSTAEQGRSTREREVQRTRDMLKEDMRILREKKQS